MRQFLFAMSCLAFLLAALGIGSMGANAFAADIVLVFCGAWCANQLVRGPEIFKAQVICVLQAYFVGVLCCSVVLFVVGWMIFLPAEYQNLGHSLLLAATFSTNIGLALFPVDSGLRFDGQFHHLWLPALIAQCCAILAICYWLFFRNPMRLLLLLSVLAVLTLLLSLLKTPAVQLLPIGSLWAFLFGAIPFIATHRFSILQYATLIGVVNLTAGVVAISAAGDTLFARILVALGLAFLYVGSRPQAVNPEATAQRRRWFGMMLHTFLWAVPMAQLNAGLNIFQPNGSDILLLIIPCLLFAIFSWTIWQHIEQKVGLNQLLISGVLAFVLLINGVIGLATQGVQLRFPAKAHAYLQALSAPEPAFACPLETEGPLQGLEVCRLGPPGAPQALVWGDQQLDALRSGFAEAARRTNVPTLLVGQANCVPLDGLQTRFSEATVTSGRSCDQLSAQIIQALPHLPSIRQVTLVADWLYYTENRSAELLPRVPVRIGPNDGTPFDITRQTDYIERAAKQTVQKLVDLDVRVSILRQVPAQPRFDAELAARSLAPGAWLYVGLPQLAVSVPMDEATRRHSATDTLFRGLAATGQMTYVNSWPAFCSETRCDARGGLSSDYITSTRLTPSGALALSDILGTDLKRSLTHVAYSRDSSG